MHDTKTKYAFRIAQLKVNYQKNAKRLTDSIEESQKAISELRKNMNNIKFEDVDKSMADIKVIDEATLNADAFDTYMRRQLGDDVVDSKIIGQYDELVRVALNDDVGLEEHVMAIAEELRKQFVKVGWEEIGVGKLTEGQFKNMMMEYVPNILTEAGVKHFAKQEIEKKIPNFGDDFGIGRIFSQHGMARTFKIKNEDGTWNLRPTIEQKNEYLNEVLKGKNAFSDNIAEIYLSRMTKHNELMYDNNYMQTMLEKFGKNFDDVDEIEAGFKPIMNYGMLKQSMKEFTSMRIGLDMDKAITDYLTAEVMKQIELKTKNSIN